MVLVIADLRFVLMGEYPPFSTQNASKSVRDAYDRWTKTNDKARLYILASMSGILSKKHEIMVTACQIMDSLREINAKMNKIEYNMTTLLKKLLAFQSLKEQKEGEENVAHSRRFAPSSSGSKKIKKKKGGKGKGPTVAAEGKEKTKVAIKGKCFPCNVDEHWKRNCPKYLTKKKEKEGATNHICSSLHETSSFKQLQEGEMTLEVGTGDVISARAVRNAKYGYLYLVEHKSEALEKFKEYKAEVENLLSKKIKILRFDRGGEYMDLRFQDNMIEHETRFQLSALVETTVHIFNNVPSNSISETPFELWRGRTPSLSHFRIWACPAQVLVINPKKLEPRSRFDTAIKSYSFDQNVDEPCVYKKINKAQFQMKDVIGIQIIRDRKNKTLALSQATYINKILCLKTPQEVEDTRRIPYASTVGSLMYAMLYTRPDICYAVGIVSRGTLHKLSSGSVERTHQSRDPEGCTCQSSDPEGYTYQSGDPEGYTYQSSASEGCTYQSGDPEGYTYQSSDLEGCTYQSSDPEGYTYQ
ncbi:gag/pol protein [Cucumis melo var. makuwa]|uniref:Gag/pol protein n=1 Tax=Cucumis melo var. makuwa TaxID=1194695 RepID=A0A5A7TSD7_CUCMM|nr:gag/pol protein [Cucumis melo var. makuwa]